MKPIQYDINASGVSSESGILFFGVIISIVILIVMFIGSPDLHDAIMYKLFDGSTQMQAKIVASIIL